MISEGSCDTEDWSNGWWTIQCCVTEIKYMLPDQVDYILKYIKNCNNISQYHCLFSYFWLNKYSLDEHSIKKH